MSGRNHHGTANNAAVTVFARTDPAGPVSSAEVVRPVEESRRASATVSLVIPAKNEATNISWVLQQIPDRVDEIVLVDGNSSDATVVTARACRPDLKVVYQDGVGKGNALRAGILTASGELIIMMDADGSMTPDEIPRIVYFLENGYDFVKGSRFMGGGGSLDITRFRRIGNRALMTMVNAIYKGGLTDLCYGFCGFHRRYIEFLDLTAPGFEVETQMTISAVRAGLRIAEVPSLELPRRHGRSNLRAISDGTRCLRTILRGHTDGVSGAAVQGVRRWLHGRAAPGPELPTQRTSGRTDPNARPASS